jgi:hypothetical protein
MPIVPSEHPLEAAVVRLSVLGGDGFRMTFDDPAVVSALAACVAGDAIEPALLAPHCARALVALRRHAPDAPLLARLLGVWTPWLERRADPGAAGVGAGEQALAARFEARLAEIVAAMELAREEGDDDRAQALHARYIELGTSYATRLARG